MSKAFHAKEYRPAQLKRRMRSRKDQVNPPASECPGCPGDMPGELSRGTSAPLKSIQRLGRARWFIRAFGIEVFIYPPITLKSQIKGMPSDLSGRTTSRLLVFKEQSVTSS